MLTVGVAWPLDPERNLRSLTFGAQTFFFLQPLQRVRGSYAKHNRIWVFERFISVEVVEAVSLSFHFSLKTTAKQLVLKIEKIKIKQRKWWVAVELMVNPSQEWD